MSFDWTMIWYSSCGSLAYFSTSRSFLSPCRIALRAEAARIGREDAQSTKNFTPPALEVSVDRLLSIGRPRSAPRTLSFCSLSLAEKTFQVRGTSAVRVQGESA